jgi:hypothetical protein
MKFLLITLITRLPDPVTGNRNQRVAGGAPVPGGDVGSWLTFDSAPFPARASGCSHATSHGRGL